MCAIGVRFGVADDIMDGCRNVSEEVALRGRGLLQWAVVGFVTGVREEDSSRHSTVGLACGWAGL